MNRNMHKVKLYFMMIYSRLLGKTYDDVTIELNKHAYFWYLIDTKCFSISSALLYSAISPGVTMSSSKAVQGLHMHSAGALVTI